MEARPCPEGHPELVGAVQKGQCSSNLGMLVGGGELTPGSADRRLRFNNDPASQILALQAPAVRDPATLASPRPAGWSEQSTPPPSSPTSPPHLASTPVALPLPSGRSLAVALCAPNELSISAPLDCGGCGQFYMNNLVLCPRQLCRLRGPRLSVSCPYHTHHDVMRGSARTGQVCLGRKFWVHFLLDVYTLIPGCLWKPRECSEGFRL